MNYNIWTLDTRNDEDDFRLIKVERYGPTDILEMDEMTLWGYDGNVPTKVPGVMLETAADDPRVIGYILKVRKARKGEVRIYATDKDQVEKNYIWLRDDNTIEVGGDSDNMVRYSKLEEAFNELKADFNNLVAKHNVLKDDFNALVTNYNDHQHTCGAPGAITTAGVPIASGVSSTATGSTSAADITPAKINEIKTS